ncbi:MAG TPA: hypothetical protein IAA03_07380 [Candidatus Ruminococcus avistercoris]|nr:hypothetical protein [Candidatus Ruminococcus avistercoris]
MKKIFLSAAAILTLLLSGCQADGKMDFSAYSDNISKAQEIAVTSAGTSEVLERITSKDDLEQFVKELEFDKWQLKALPDQAAEIGSFQLSQEETVQYGQKDTDGTLKDIAALTLYDGFYVGFEVDDLDLTFQVSEETADYLNGFFR